MRPVLRIYGILVLIRISFYLIFLVLFWKIFIFYLPHFFITSYVDNLISQVPTSIGSNFHFNFDFITNNFCMVSKNIERIRIRNDNTNQDPKKRRGSRSIQLSDNLRTADAYGTSKIMLISFL